MPYWVKLTSAEDHAKAVFVNLENVTHLVPRGPGAQVCFSGDDQSYVHVAEQPSDIVKLNALDYAHRS